MKETAAYPVPTEHHLPLALRTQRRRQRIAALEAALAPCEWCGRGLGISSVDHSGCRRALAK